MAVFLNEVLQKAHEQGLVPEINPAMEIPVPGINKVELYLTFHGNDCCSHCITCSGPHREETMDPETARRTIDTIAQYSITARLPEYLGKGKPVFYEPKPMRHFDVRQEPPRELTDSLFSEYADCIMGKGGRAVWMRRSEKKHLNFSRPSIRISGGEFSTWPHRIGGRTLSETERISHQQELLGYIREKLPEYDIWILTNGRFAESAEKTAAVINTWASGTIGPEKEMPGRGKLRVCVSVDPFHQLPRKTSLEEMLERLWKAAREAGLSAPYIYGIPNKTVFLLGRALKTYVSGNKSCFKGFDADPINLRQSDGCSELKGFFLKTPQGPLLLNNIVVNYDAHLAYCCACVGDYGNLLHSPEQTLRNLVSDPISRMLRMGESAETFLQLAAAMDPSIHVFDNQGGAATGAVCYQLLSGMRVGKKNGQLFN